ncbi:peptide transporter [Thermococcus sp.]|uniref:peptide transporter n=1 Tax=Thermococcus sp. TaxID=35749 RepID=UPI0026314D6F|nr:peptide transporter [Thermococcus sp.]
MVKKSDRKRKERKVRERKSRKEQPESLKKLSKYYQRIKTYGIAALVLILAYYGYLIRVKSARLRYFIDPDTFFHFEMFRQAVRHGVPTYFPYANPPAGVKVDGSLGLYAIPAKVYNILFAPLGYSELHFFKIWTPLLGALTIIGIYLLGRKLHSDWTGFWAAAFLAFSYANYSKTYSGNARGEAPFLMFFVFAILSMAYYLDAESNFRNVKKLTVKLVWGSLFVVLSWLFMMSWQGSEFGLGILLLFMPLHSIVLFTFGRIGELRRFTIELYSAMLVVLLGGLALTRVSLVGYRSFLVFSLEAYFAALILNLVMLFGQRVGLNYSDKAHRLGTVVGIGIAAFIGAYAYFGRDLWKFLAGAYQSNPLYQTVAELARPNWGYVKNVFSIHYGRTGAGQDGMLYILSVLGFAVLLLRMLWKYRKGDVTGYKEMFLAVYYSAATYFLWTAVRFSFQASGAVLLLAGLFIGELMVAIEKLNDTVGTKAMYAIVLILLFIPLPVIGARDMGRLAASQAAHEAVPASWQNALLWMRNSTNPLDSATSWWDYGYWIESSLLSHRRASTDGGHAYDRRYVLAKFFSHSGSKSEVDFEAWGLNYLITWQSDIYKFNAISYLGGAITYGEYKKTPMFMPVSSQYGAVMGFDNTTKSFYVRVRTARGVLTYIPEMVINLARGGSVYRNKNPNINYVLYIFSQSFGILAYKKIAFSNFVQLAFNYINPLNITESMMLRANFKLVKSEGDVNVYRFSPFGVYRIDELTNGTVQNGTWKMVYSTLSPARKLPLGNHTFRVYISAFGRDVTNGTLVFEAYNGSKLVEREVLAKNLHINHLHERPILVSFDVPNATSYRMYILQKGPVGVLDGPVKVNGREVNPSSPIAPGRSGEIQLKAAFRRGYDKVTLAMRAMVTYYLTPNGKDIYKDDFYLEPHQDVVAYIPLKTLSVSAGDNEISAHVSVPSDLFTSFIQKLRAKYGSNFDVAKKRLEPVFITEKEYVVWEG